MVLSTGYKTLRTRIKSVQSVVRGWCERTMFSSKHSADEMLLRSEQSNSSARFPLNLIRRTYNQIFNPRDISSYYHHLALLAEAPQPPLPLEAQIRTDPRRDECSDRVECIPSPKAMDLEYRDWTKSQLPRDCGHSGLLSKRHRGEKKAIPEEQKDGKYFERRKRNNEAAKRSRDARKLREDRIAFRASILEQENAILKSQVFSLRDEITTLRQMIFPSTTSLPMGSK